MGPSNATATSGLGYGDYYMVVRALAQEVMSLSKTCVIGGVDPTDQYRKIPKVLKDYARAAGFSE